MTLTFLATPHRGDFVSADRFLRAVAAELVSQDMLLVSLDPPDKKYRTLLHITRSSLVKQVWDLYEHKRVEGTVRTSATFAYQPSPQEILELLRKTFGDSVRLSKK